MIEDQELFEKIEAYLDDELSSSEKTEFESHLSSNELLANEIDKQRIIKEGLNDSDALDFRNKLNKISKKNKAKKEKPSYRLERWHKVAAVVSLLIAAGAIFWLTNKSPNEGLYESYYSHYEVQKVQRGGEPLDKSITPFRYYINRQYDKAIAPFITLKENEIYDVDEINIYLGNCYLNTQNTDLALRTFRQVEEESIYFDDALWYIALTYLSQNDMQNAKNTLSILLSQNTIYDQPASDLLNKIN